MRVQQEVQRDVDIAQRAARKPGLSTEQRREIVSGAATVARKKLKDLK
jgi:hypothetical protein